MSMAASSKILLLVAGLAAFAALAGVQPHTADSAQAPPPKTSPTVENVPFQVGETFTYIVSWKIFDAGIATLTLADRVHSQNEDVYRFRAIARSTGIVSTLFKVYDIFESQVNVKDLCSRKIVKNVQEGRRQRTTIVTFDHKSHQSRMEDIDLTRPELPPKRSETSIPLCVQDVISAFYFVRTKNLRIGETLRFPINDGGKTYDVDVEVQAVEAIKTPAGTFQALRLEPRVFGGLFKKKGRMFVWFTNDAERIPIQLKAKIAMGTITASLTKVDKAPSIQAAPVRSKN
jgi:hypothetical protein